MREILKKMNFVCREVDERVPMFLGINRDKLLLKSISCAYVQLVLVNHLCNFRANAQVVVLKRVKCISTNEIPVLYVIKFLIVYKVNKMYFNLLI